MLDGDPASLKKGEQQPPHFRPVYSCQTARWIKMSLSTKVGLGRGHIVRWGPSYPKRGNTYGSTFGPHVLWPNGYPSQLLLSTCQISCQILSILNLLALPHQLPVTPAIIFCFIICCYVKDVFSSSFRHLFMCLLLRQ